LPRRDDNPAIYDLILELLADHGLPAPRRRARALPSLAAIVQHIATGHGWAVVAASVAAQPAAGTVSRRLDATLTRPIRLDAVWHRTHQTSVTAAFLDELGRAMGRVQRSSA
jgi:DNA-binding transcriptional LysR family regulator